MAWQHLRSSVVGRRSSVVGRRSSVVGRRSSVVGHRIPASSTALDKESPMARSTYRSHDCRHCG
jgi:hypothetical protein